MKFSQIISLATFFSLAFVSQAQQQQQQQRGLRGTSAASGSLRPRRRLPVESMGGVAPLSGGYGGSGGGQSTSEALTMRLPITTAPTPALPTHPVGPDLAQHCNVSVSSTWRNWKLYDAQHMVDGDSGSRWTSRYEDNQTVQIDLGHAFLIDMVRLRWQGAYAQSYELQLSNTGDDGAWTTVMSTNNSFGGMEVLTFEAQEAQYVKLNLFTRATIYGFSLWDFEVYQTQTSITQQPIPSEPVANLAEPTTPNLIANNAKCIVDASTTYKNWNYYNVSHLIDANNETRWASERHDNQKIYLDLGDAYDNINRIRIDWQEEAHASSYEIWLSKDGHEWTTVYSTNNCMGGLEDLVFETQEARYIHINLLTQANEFGFSICDIEVYQQSI